MEIQRKAQKANQADRNSGRCGNLLLSGRGRSRSAGTSWLWSLTLLLALVSSQALAQPLGQILDDFFKMALCNFIDWLGRIELPFGVIGIVSIVILVIIMYGFRLLNWSDRKFCSICAWVFLGFWSPSILKFILVQSFDACPGKGLPEHFLPSTKLEIPELVPIIQFIS